MQRIIFFFSFLPYPSSSSFSVLHSTVRAVWYFDNVVHRLSEYEKERESVYEFIWWKMHVENEWHIECDIRIEKFTFCAVDGDTN